MQENASHEKDAVIAAEKWLELVDSERFKESWDQSADLFKSAVTSDEWEAAVKAARDPLGKLVSRELKSKTFTEQLPGAPDGKYVVAIFEASFERKQQATETATLLKDADGEWHIVGYFVR